MVEKYLRTPCGPFRAFDYLVRISLNSNSGGGSARWSHAHLSECLRQNPAALRHARMVRFPICRNHALALPLNGRKFGGQTHPQTSWNMVAIGSQPRLQIGKQFARAGKTAPHPPQNK